VSGFFGGGGSCDLAGSVGASGSAAGAARTPDRSDEGPRAEYGGGGTVTAASECSVGGELSEP